jgi:hypothetical protein
MLLAFLDRFDRLGWFPPMDLEKRRVLAAHDVIMHVVREDLCFYEFCWKGARGERDPWLCIFFHVAAGAQIRICAVEPCEAIDAAADLLSRTCRNPRETARTLASATQGAMMSRLQSASPRRSQRPSDLTLEQALNRIDDPTLANSLSIFFAELARAQLEHDWRRRSRSESSDRRGDARHTRRRHRSTTASRSSQARTQTTAALKC